MYAGTELEQRPWSDAQRQQFVRDGYIRVNNAFSPEIAAEARAILWRDTGCDPDDPSTWVRPVIRLNDYNQAPFRAAANTPVLRAAFDELVGPGRWLPRESLGGFPIRFPHADDPKDTGWHVDTSFPPEEPVESYFDWRVNVTSRGRALLMLFLFSDVTDKDAPTRIRLGSHLRIARRLALAGAAGMSGRDLAAELEELTGGIARDRCDRPGRNRVPVSSIPGACGTAALWGDSSLSGTATPASEGPLRVTAQRYRSFAGRTGDPSGAQRRNRTIAKIDPLYSALSARMGSMDAARCAGTRAARAEQQNRTRTAPPIAALSSGLTP